MSKRTVYTETSALPANISREIVLDFLHNHLEMIDLNPLVKERHPIPPPADAPEEERTCVWYSLTDKITYLPGGIAAGDVSYTAAFNDLPNGIQTHCRAPLGVDIRSRWTLNGTLPGEPPERTEIGLNIPQTGLYIREDVEIRCNVLMSSFVKKTTKKAHNTLLEALGAKARAVAGYSGSNSSTSGSIAGSSVFRVGRVGSFASISSGSTGSTGSSGYSLQGYNNPVSAQSQNQTPVGYGQSQSHNHRHTMMSGYGQQQQAPQNYGQQNYSRPQANGYSNRDRSGSSGSGPTTRQSMMPSPAAPAWPGPHGQPTPPGSQRSSPQPSPNALAKPSPEPAIPIQQRFSMYAALTPPQPQGTMPHQHQQQPSPQPSQQSYPHQQHYQYQGQQHQHQQQQYRRQPQYQSPRQQQQPQQQQQQQQPQKQQKPAPYSLLYTPPTLSYAYQGQSQPQQQQQQPSPPQQHQYQQQKQQQSSSQLVPVYAPPQPHQQYQHQRQTPQQQPQPQMQTQPRYQLQDQPPKVQQFNPRLSVQPKSDAPPHHPAAPETATLVSPPPPARAPPTPPSPPASCSSTAPPPPPPYSTAAAISSPFSNYSDNSVQSSPLASPVDTGGFSALYPNPLRIRKASSSTCSSINSFRNNYDNNTHTHNKPPNIVVISSKALDAPSAPVDYSLIYPEMSPYGANGEEYDDGYDDILVETPLEEQIAAVGQLATQLATVLEEEQKKREEEEQERQRLLLQMQKQKQQQQQDNNKPRQIVEMQQKHHHHHLTPPTPNYFPGFSSAGTGTGSGTGSANREPVIEFRSHPAALTPGGGMMPCAVSATVSGPFTPGLM